MGKRGRLAGASQVLDVSIPGAPHPGLPAKTGRGVPIQRSFRTESIPKGDQGGLVRLVGLATKRRQSGSVQNPFCSSKMISEVPPTL